ncbi:MAG: hemerythrin domain-containing protein [Candidatus Caldarchaeum sp.]
MKDHEVILNAVSRLQQRVENWRRIKTIDSVESLRNFIEFARTFTDKCHHGKEERCLFPCLESMGIPREGGPIGVMLYEHELGRQLIRRLDNALQKYVQTREGLDEVLDVCDEYISLITQHISKENDVLFPMGQSVTPAEEREKTVECYEHIEHHEIGHETHHRLEKLSEKI